MANPKLPNQPSEEELNSFLSKVDQLDDVLKGLNSQDDDEKIRYTAKADELIEKFENEKKQKENEKLKDTDDPDLPETKFGFSKTIINKDAYKNDPPTGTASSMQGPDFPQGTDAVDQKAFMAAMEADAKERYERKKAAEKVAAVWKEKGNAAFRQGNYQEALDLYDKAISEVRDSSVLYTNRAQAKIKLGKFEEALSDCDWALRAWPNCLKAYVHQGHAQMGLHQWEKARESYKAVLSLDATKGGVVKDYLAEVDRREQAMEEEQKAARLFEDGNEAAHGIVDLLTRVNKADQVPIYYAGGFRVIANLLVDINSQTLFRTNEGLKLPTAHAVLHRCLTSSTASLSREEKDLLSAALDMLTAACKNNETNQQQLLAQSDFSQRLLCLLETKVKVQGRHLRSSCLSLLYEISLTEAGRVALVENVDLVRLIRALFPLMKSSSSYNTTAVAVLNNIALEKKSKTALRDKIESILPAFEDLLKSNETSAKIVGVASSTATNLAADVRIRSKMASRSGLWQSLTQRLTSFNDAGLTESLSNVLGLSVNLSTGVEDTILQCLDTSLTSALNSILVKSHETESRMEPESSNTSGNISDQDGQQEVQLREREITVRALVVLSNILTVNSASVDFISEGGRAAKILEFTKCKECLIYKPALKCLTALTKSCHDVRVLVMDNKGLSTLLNQLTNQDETIVGNAALCLSHLTQDSELDSADKSSKQTLGARVCARLAKTNIVQRLLTLARDGRNSTLQGNCAILLGKLAQGDSRHLERLRELNGIQILHDCMKHVNY
ncbi:tetratricopeptide repeat protein 12 [Elysia marginata]|uniref:Tetratricopeptide repeat protein 12 n=1 Tax=Elysia marginata TaxID=1093978 RepID=A0AAV4FBS7_9GAST|nr:tetratricopeptide repeat protein 12 [Elysia marginata]